jgi:arylesterase/paraoxonase
MNIKRKIWRYTWIGMSILTFALSVLVVINLFRFNVLSTLSPHFDLTYERVGEFVGGEDLQIDWETGLVYVSAFDRRKHIYDDPSLNGAIYVFDLADPKGTVRVASKDAPSMFRPHGLSLYKGKDGSRRLFVVNHRDKDHSIEIFNVSKKGDLTLEESITGEKLISPNDVAAVGPRQFYFTNEANTDNQLRILIDSFTWGGRDGSLVYFDGADFTILKTEIAYANGVNVSADGQYVYVAEMLGECLSIFKKNQATGGLVLEEQVALNSKPDNIDIAEDGSIWIACHPKYLKLIGHFQDPAKLSPTQLIKVNHTPGIGTVVKEIFLSTGKEISGGTVGAFHNGILLLGSVTEKGVLVCPLEP